MGVGLAVIRCDQPEFGLPILARLGHLVGGPRGGRESSSSVRSGSTDGCGDGSPGCSVLRSAAVTPVMPIASGSGPGLGDPRTCDQLAIESAAVLSAEAGSPANYSS